MTILSTAVRFSPPFFSLPSFYVFVVLLATFLSSPHAQALTATTTTLTVTDGGAVKTVTSGTVVTLTARVEAGSTAISPGQVRFCDATAKYCTDIHVLALAQLTKAGTAAFKFIPGPGSHSYKAVFLGTNAVAPSTSAVSTLQVTEQEPVKTTTTISVAGKAGDYALSAKVTGSAGIAPAGTVSFIDTTNANFVLGTGSLGKTTASGLSFGHSASPAVGAAPLSISVADFNGDGRPDVLVSDFLGNASEQVSVLLGSGNGLFNAPLNTTFPTFYAAYTTVGDFNADGKPDLAVLGNYENASGIAILLGKGDGTFTLGSFIAGPDGSFITTADLNGDGIADLVVAGYAGNSLMSFIGQENGTFVSGPTLALATRPEGIVAADFNGDGKADVAVVTWDGTLNTDGQVNILLGQGDGSFKTAAVSSMAGNSSVGITVGDFNNDGKADLATANQAIGSSTASTTPVTVLLGNGDGTFKSVAGPVGGQVYAITVGDVNGDGIADLIAADDTLNGAAVFLGKGNGTFAMAQNAPIGSGPVGIATGDFNGDGLADIAGLIFDANEAPSSVPVYLSQLTETTTATATGIFPDGTGAHFIAASYSGNDDYAVSVSAATSVASEKVATALTLTASPSSVKSGATVIFKAVLDPDTAQEHNATGSVTFTLGATTLGTVKLASGSASLSVKTLPIGTDAITAMYAGDANFEAATSAKKTVVVTK